MHESPASVWTWLKAHGAALTVALALVANIFLMGHYAGRIETRLENGARESGELKSTINAIGEDVRRITLDRIEDARTASYLRSQNEVISAKLSAIDATLRERGGKQ